MKRLILPLLAALALPTAVNAETSLAEKMSAEQKNVAVLKAFNQCKINQGLSAETLKKQAYEVLDSYRIDKQLLNNNDVEKYSQFLLGGKNFCSNFDAFNSYKEYISNSISSGEDAFNNLGGKQRKIVEIMTYSGCMVNTGKFSMEEYRKFTFGSIEKLASDDVELDTLLNSIDNKEFQAAGGWLMTKVNPIDCEILGVKF